MRKWNLAPLYVKFVSSLPNQGRNCVQQLFKKLEIKYNECTNIKLLPSSLPSHMINPHILSWALIWSVYTLDLSYITWFNENNVAYLIQLNVVLSI